MLLKRCCCELRSGALAVAIVFLSLSVALSLGVLIGWGAADGVRAFWSRRFRERLRDGGVSSDYDYYYSSASIQGVDVLAPLTVSAILQLTFDSLLLHGVRISKTCPSSARRYLVSWIIFRAVWFGIISLGSVCVLITAIILRYTEEEVLSVFFGGHFVLSAIVSGLFWYAWVVVLSFYWQLREPEATGIIFSRIQTEETAELGPRREEGQAAAAGGASASQVDGRGKNVGQKWI